MCACVCLYVYVCTPNQHNATHKREIRSIVMIAHHPFDVVIGCRLLYTANTPPKCVRTSNALTNTHKHSAQLTYTHSHAHPLTHPYTHTLIHCSPTHTPLHSHTHTLLTHSHTYTLTHSHTHTHTLTHFRRLGDCCAGDVHPCCLCADPRFCCCCC